MSSIRVVARALARTASRQLLCDALSACVAPTRREPGCVRYELAQSVTDPDEFVMLEEWRSQADLDAHMASPHVAQLLQAIPAFVAAAPEIKTYRVIG
jgi:quinol monooxygenase YgiN